MLSKSILSYQGPLSFSTIDWLLSEFKVHAQDFDISFTTYKKMISVMIEALENVTKYSDPVVRRGRQAPAIYPSCRISCNESVIQMETTNPVRKREVRPLMKRIDEVNKHDNLALKELYMSTINNGEFSATGGAGLGFIEIAKTAGSKLEYAFEALSKDYTLYTFRVSMNK